MCSAITLGSIYGFKGIVLVQSFFLLFPLRCSFQANGAFRNAWITH